MTRSDPLRLVFVGSPGSTFRPIPACPAEAVEMLWGDRVPMVLSDDAFAPLDAWARELHGRRPPSFPGWRAEGPGREPVDAQSLIEWLRARAATTTPFTFNALHLERQGGRNYPFVLQGYAGPLPVSERQYAAAKRRGPRLLLAAIRRDVRALLRAPRGWTLLEGDFKTCHGYLALALTGDEALAADLGADFHQATGDALVPALAPPARRDFGKALNNAMLFGLSPRGARRIFRASFEVDPGEQWAKQAHAWWWGRYPQFAALRDKVERLVGQAQVENRALHIVAPSERISKFSAAEVRGKVSKGDRRAPGPAGMWRTVFSAVFRAVEGDLLDRTLAHWHHGREAHGGRLALPLYDGLLVAAPVGAEGAVAAALEAAGAHAAAELGVSGLRMEVKQVVAPEPTAPGPGPAYRGPPPPPLPAIPRFRR